uniref:Uncharacterized protein n=1 Tax=Magallana gigas TaxID=29159 RepID=A0A8W8MB79_MAGGI
MKVLGKIDLEFEIGEIRFCREFIVAELGNLRGIIGMDFLENNDVIFQISRGLLVIGARMADVLQLSVEQEEMEELIGTSFPREWPSDGQACSIPSCPSGEHVFHKIGSYRAHFIKFHKEFVPVYYCPKEGCSFRAFKITPIRKHWDKKHPGLQGCILCRNIKNPRYCDPGQTVMSLPTIHRDARDRAAEARRRASASSTPLFQLPTCYNARDMKPHRF